MLPGSSPPERVRRETKGAKGRTQEIQRLIGRSLRAVCDMETLGEMQVTVDCDVLQADGGTRTASICGGYLALHDALTRRMEQGLLEAHPITQACAAISVGIIEGEPRLDLPYVEDANAETDMNVVMTEAGDFVEVQGTAEGAAFTRSELDALLGPGREGHQRDHRHAERARRRGPDATVKPVLVTATANPHKVEEIAAIPGRPRSSCCRVPPRSVTSSRTPTPSRAMPA